MRSEEEGKFRPENNTGYRYQVQRKPAPFPVRNRANRLREKASHRYGGDTKGEHIGKRPGSIVDDMELAGLKEQVPYRCSSPECFSNAERVRNQSRRIKQAQNSSR